MKKKRLQPGAFLMKTVFKLGKTFIINKYEGLPSSIAKREAFKQKDGLNSTRTSDEFYWVKIIY